MSERLPKRKPQKKYLIAVEEIYSIVALAVSVIILICTMAAVFLLIGDLANEGDNALHYFTVLSNLLSTAGAAFMLPFAVEGIRKKRFVLPRWIVLFHYAGATCVAITMISSLVIILPTQGMNDTMTGPNFWLHIVTPACTVVLFQCVESDIVFTRRDILLSLAPYWIYTAVYSIMVFWVGKDRGGWSDFYMTQAFWPAWVSLLLMLTLGFLISVALRLIHNKRAAESRKRLMRGWNDRMDPAQPLIEAFGLGRYIGAKCSTEELTVPLDIFAMMAERYDIPLERLTKAYCKGAIDSIKERRAK